MNETNRPWYVGWRKWSFAVLVLAALTATAIMKIIDGAQYIGAVGALVAAFFVANKVPSKAATNG